MRKSFMVVGYVILVALVPVMLFALFSGKKIAAAEPVAVQEVWHDNTMAIFEVNVGGGCHLYIVRAVSGVGFSADAPAVVAGQGCRQ